MNRSRLKKLPITPASSSSSHARYGFSSWCGSAPRMASGNSTPVSTTRNSEIPSTPRCHEMPHSWIHVCFETNWNPGSSRRTATSSQMLSAAGEHAGEQADQLDQLRPALAGDGDRERAGDRRQHDHGEDRKAGVVHYEDPPDDDEPSEQHHHADADDPGVGAHVAALALAQAAGDLDHLPAGALDGAVDDVGVEPARRPRTPRAGPADEVGDRLVVVPGVGEDRRLARLQPDLLVHQPGGDDACDRGDSGDEHQQRLVLSGPGALDLAPRRTRRRARARAPGGGRARRGST